MRFKVSEYFNLVLQVGDSKDGVRRDVRTIFRLLYKVYPASKVFSYLIDGLKSKNTKQRMGKCAIITANF